MCIRDRDGGAIGEKLSPQDFNFSIQSGIAANNPGSFSAARAGARGEILLRHANGSWTADLHRFCQSAGRSAGKLQALFTPSITGDARLREHTDALALARPA